MIDKNEKEQDNTVESYGDDALVKEKKNISKYKVIFTLIGVVLLIFAAIAFFFLQQKKQREEANIAALEAKKQEETMFTSVNDIIVNLDTKGKGISFLKLKVILQVKGKSNADRVEKMMPKVVDIMQTYLRELKPSDLSGSYGLYKLREELLLRINAIVYPTQVEDLLFENILIQ